MDYFFTVLGMVLVIEGLPYFTFPDKMKSVMEKIPQLPSYWLRIFGFSLFSLGLFLMYLTRYYFFES